VSASLRRTDATAHDAVAGPRHFLDLRDFDTATLRHMLDISAGFKGAHGVSSRPLAGRTLALIFEKPSTRTRVSFEVAMRQLGGDVIVLSAKEIATRAHAEGVIVLTCGTHGNVLRFLPPLSMPLELLEEAFDVVAEAFEATA
jgi:hypothetical protein